MHVLRTAGHCIFRCCEYMHLPSVIIVGVLLVLGYFCLTGRSVVREYGLDVQNTTGEYPEEIAQALTDFTTIFERAGNMHLKFSTSRLLLEGAVLPDPNDAELSGEEESLDSEVLRMLELAMRDLGVEFALHQTFLEIMRRQQQQRSGIRHDKAFMGILPVSGRLSSNYGWRRSPFGGFRSKHHGIDIAAPQGTPIRVVGPGIVLRSTRWGGYGNMVDIYHGRGVVTRYAHMSRVLVQRGDYLRRGDILGLVGSTGRSTGPHLHFEIRIRDTSVNPLHLELLTTLAKGLV